MRNFIRISLGLAAALASQQLLAQTEITALPFTASQAGETYVLARDLTSSSGAAITVAADNVTIDGKGHTITYATSGAGNGVRVQHPVTSLEVRNLTLNQGNYDPAGGEDVNGIVVTGNASGLYIHHNKINVNHSGAQAGAYGSGISLSRNSQRSWGNRIAYNTITVRGTSGGYGIGLDPGAPWQGQIYRNRIRLAEMGRQPAGYGRAIAISGRGPIRIYHNEIELDRSLSQVQGISLWNGDGHIIRDNIITADSSHTRAILIDGDSDDNTVYRNKVTLNDPGEGGASAGIRVRYGSDRTMISKNEISASGQGTGAFGLRIGEDGGFGDPQDTVVRDNIFRSGSRAVSLEAGTDVLFYRNTIQGTGSGAGLYLYASSNIRFNHDTITGPIYFVGADNNGIEFCNSGVQPGQVDANGGSYRAHTEQCSYPTKDVPAAPRSLKAG